MNWDGLAVVNSGDRPTFLGLKAFNDQGDPIEAFYPAEPLPIQAKGLFSLSDVFRVRAAWYEITGDSLVVIALRGDGDSTFLWKNAALPMAPASSNEMVSYRVDIDNTWSVATHPDAYSGILDPHFSFFGGATHHEGISLWQLGKKASAGMTRMAETGHVDLLVEEAGALDGVFGVLAFEEHTPSPGRSSFDFQVSSSGPLVTLVSMVGPSPDWFVGVSGLNLSDSSGWKDTVQVPLFPFDGGTRERNDFQVLGPLTLPQGPITAIDTPPLRARALGHMTFTRLARIRLDLTAGGVSLNWAWPGNSASRVRLVRSDVERILFQTDDRGVTSFTHQTPNLGMNHYRVDFLNHVNKVLESVEAEIVVPSPMVETDAAVVVSEAGHYPCVADINGDDLPELLGTINQGDGQLKELDSATIGLNGLFRGEGGFRVNRDVRLADLDNDGDPDLITNGYSEIDDPNTEALLFWNDGSGFFTEDTAFREKKIKGFGETILTFDSDNDGDLDLFIPFYSHNHEAEQSFFFENDGIGGFNDVTDRAGVALRNLRAGLKVEGAHAADVNDDGYIDFFVASHLFINRGDGTFFDGREASGLPQRFDEGLAFLDWNADGLLDLVTLHPSKGPELYQQVGLNALLGEPALVPDFCRVDVLPQLTYEANYGLKVMELNNDGLPDICIASGPDLTSILLVNHRENFVRNPPLLEGIRYDVSSYADFDGDNRIDIVRKIMGGRLAVQRNTTQNKDSQVFWIRVLGEGGLYNQHGRVIRARPVANPDFVITRVVEGGSGFLSQGQYEQHFGSPFPGPHTVTVGFANGEKTFTIYPGQRLQVTQDGQVTAY